MGTTAIEWTDRTVNPIRARNRQTGNVGHYCERISPGCANCYAATWNVKRRHGRKDGKVDPAGTGLDFTPRNRTQVDVFFDEAALVAEAKRKTASKIFPCDMTDLFGDWVRDDWRIRMWDIMWAAPHHTWQVLTKRPERMLRFVREYASRLKFGWCSRYWHTPLRPGMQLSLYDNGMRNECGWYRRGICDHPRAEPDGNEDEESGGHPWCNCQSCPIGEWVNDRPSLEAWQAWDEGAPSYRDDDAGFERLESPGDPAYIELHSRPKGAFAPNIWLGCTVENQRQLRRRIGALRALREIVPHAVIWLSVEPLLGPLDLREAFETVTFSGCGGLGDQHVRIVDWVVVGGESGSGARPMHPDWARSIRSQCQAAAVPFFFKQWGEWAPVSQWDGDTWSGQAVSVRHDGAVFATDEPHGFCCSNCSVEESLRVGKKAAGRLLDGREWSEFPAAKGGA